MNFRFSDCRNQFPELNDPEDIHSSILKTEYRQIGNRRSIIRLGFNLSPLT